MAANLCLLMVDLVIMLVTSGAAGGSCRWWVMVVAVDGNSCQWWMTVVADGG